MKTDESTQTQFYLNKVNEPWHNNANKMSVRKAKPQPGPVWASVQSGQSLHCALSVNLIICGHFNIRIVYI